MKIEDVTIIIKTFNRRQSLWRLLKSIDEHYPSMKVIVLDDSKKNYKNETLSKFKVMNLLYITTEFDVGLSKGRNILIDAVETDFFLLCDDDFCFDKRTDIKTAKRILVENDYDILGGNIFNIFEFNSFYSILWALKKPKRFLDVIQKKEKVSIYNGNFEGDKLHTTLNLSTLADDYLEKESYKSEIVSNFFIARTNPVKNISGWQPESIKVGEHQAFFYRATKAGMNIGYTASFGVKHYPKKTLSYNRYRLRSYAMIDSSFEYLGFKSYTTNINGVESYKFNSKTEQEAH